MVYLLTSFKTLLYNELNICTINKQKNILNISHNVNNKRHNQRKGDNFKRE